MATIKPTTALQEIAAPFFISGPDQLYIERGDSDVWAVQVFSAAMTQQGKERVW